MNVAWCVGSGVTDAGGRARNEDAFLSLGPVHVVADGMGGHLAGAAASEAVVRAFRPLVDLSTVTPDDVAEAVERAQIAVEQLGERLGGDSGSTMTGAIAVQHAGQAWWMIVNIGDSRVYVLDGGTLLQVTVDHSYVQELVDRGDITPAQAESHPQRNIVTRAVGDGVRGFDAWLLPARPGRRLVVASDGLMKAMSDSRIATTVSLAGESALAAERLVDAAVQAGATDNVTAVVVDTLHAQTGADADPTPWRVWGTDEDDDTTVSGRRRESV